MCKYLSFILFLIVTAISCDKHSIEADILINNGIVYNGLDTTSKNVSIAIKDDRIVYIGMMENQTIKAKRIIDASNMVVSPGFIDPHTHADRELVDDELAHNMPFLMQGITTVVVGNDGDSFYPSQKYITKYESQGIGTNAVLLIGHATIREQVLGKSNNTPNKNELQEMEQLVQQEMDAGAFGMSTGLFYAPGSYSTTHEVVSLAKIVAKNNGIYDTHLRDESSYSIGLIPAVNEAIQIGREANIPVHISHIKCLGVDVWNQSDSIIKTIIKSREEGLNITANQYPYEASATGLKAAVVPRWAESGGKDSLYIRFQNSLYRNKILEETKTNIFRRGGADKLLIVKSENKDFVGKNVQQISQELGLTPEETVYEIIRDSYARVASFNMNPKDIKNFMKQSWVFTGSDGNTGHPRKYGSFPRKFDQYVKKQQVLTLGSFIQKSTYHTASFLKIPKRGSLEKGNFADIIIFDPNTFKDQATYKDAFKLATGLKYSIINGQLAVDQERFTKKRSGRVLKK